MLAVEDGGGFGGGWPIANGAPRLGKCGKFPPGVTAQHDTVRRRILELPSGTVLAKYAAPLGDVDINYAHLASWGLAEETLNACIEGIKEERRFL